MIKELELARFSSLPEEWTDQVSVRKETRAVRHLSVDVITCNQDYKKREKTGQE